MCFCGKITSIFLKIKEGNVVNATFISILFVICAYLLGMLWIGFYYARKNASTADFYLGGRKLGPLVTAMSAEASDMSSYLLMGLPGLAYLSGVADVGWTVVGLAAGTYLNWLLTARRLRCYTQLTKSITLPQFFSRRFHDEKNVLSAIAAVIIIVFFIPYTASGFAACGKLFSSLFGWDYLSSMMVSAFVIVGYTASGGFLAASITDFIQSIVMTIAILVALVFATNSAGGIDAVMKNAQSLPGFLSWSESFSEATGAATPYGFLTIVSTLAWGLGYFGMPHILLRFMAIEDDSKLKISRRVASVWVVVAMAVAVLIGIVGRALSGVGALETLSGSRTETIIVRIADLLSQHGLLASLMAGLILSGILASTMSTADSQLLAASSSVSQNILQEALGIKLSERAGMLAARFTVIVIAVLGFVIARNPDSSVFGIVAFAWAGFGAGFGPIVICSLFWKRTTLAGALFGMVAGGVSIFVWKFLLKPLGGVFGIYELLPAFIVGIVMTILVSLLTKAPDQTVIAEFDAAAKMARGD